MSLGSDGAIARVAMEALACDKWVGLGRYEWNNDIWDICGVPGTDSLWAVGGSYWGPDGIVAENGNPVVCRSTDGGYTWQIDQPEFESDSLLAATVILWEVRFVNARVGFASGGAVSTPANSTTGVMYRTRDGGLNWTLVYEGRVGPLYPRHVIGDMDFVDEMNGWAVGAIDQYDNVAIIHTNDGGDTWVHQTSGVDAAVGRVDFVDMNVGWAVGEVGTVVKTLDGGVNWELMASPPNIPALHACVANQCD